MARTSNKGKESVVKRISNKRKNDSDEENIINSPIEQPKKMQKKQDEVRFFK